MIDQERTMTEVHALAEEARETNPAPAGARQERSANDRVVGLIAPIYMGTTGIIPERYIVHYTIARCANCQTESRYNEFFALTYLRSRINGTRVRHLTRCDRPEFNLPVDRIPVGTRGIPFCCECTSIDLSHLPPPPSAASLMDLPDVVQKGRAAAKRSERQRPAPVKPASLDDLI
jgi:hypothetical protein